MRVKIGFWWGVKKNLRDYDSLWPSSGLQCINSTRGIKISCRDHHDKKVEKHYWLYVSIHFILPLEAFKSELLVFDFRIIF